MLSKNLKNLRKGFTLVEIMIVVLIIGILLAIAIPNFVRARESARTKSCVSNLKQIQSAATQLAMDKKLAPTAAVAIDDIAGPGLYIKVTPLCPSTQAAYADLASVDADPVCPNPQVSDSTAVKGDALWHGLE